MNSSSRAPNMNTICYMRKTQCIIQIKQCFRFKWFTCLYDNARTFCNFSWNTFNMFNPIQFIVNYDSQKFSVINFLDTGSIYMDGRTIFFYTLGSEYHIIKWTAAAVPQTWIPYVIWGKINALYKLSNVSDSNDLRAFMIMPEPFAIFREIHLICSIQFSLLSIMIPRNLASSTSWILDPCIWMVGQFFFTLGSEYNKICFIDIQR